MGNCAFMYDCPTDEETAQNVEHLCINIAILDLCDCKHS
jgi:hypothetical protein